MRDYHIHTNNSFDSVAKMEDYCRRAIELGLKEVAFTEHFDSNPTDESTGFFDYQRYVTDIMHCRNLFGDQLKITAGLELGEPHEYWESHEEFKKGKIFELFIGSVHFVGGEVIHRTYREGETADQIYENYFKELHQTIQIGNFNLVAHLDVIKRYVPQQNGRFEPDKYRVMIEDILKDIIRSPLAIEVNSSGLRQVLQEPLPAYEIIRWYQKLGGTKIVYASDSHRIEHLASDYHRLEKEIKDMGFKGFHYWEDGEWKVE